MFYFEIIVGCYQVAKIAWKDPNVPFTLFHLLIISYLTIVQYQNQETDTGVKYI